MRFATVGRKGDNHQALLLGKRGQELEKDTSTMIWIAPSEKDADNAAQEKRLWDALSFGKLFGATVGDSAAGLFSRDGKEEFTRAS